MAWNGGVSLAVWMGGVAVELDAARRAHVDPEPRKDPARPVYGAICEAFDRVLVIDILAGASAGGINGALLGAVITAGRRLDPDFLRRRWLELGDLTTLLQPIAESRPPSLLKGDYFLKSLKETFREVLGEDKNEFERLSESESAVEPGEVVLDVQTTNVAGTVHGFADRWNQMLYAHEYRAPLQFRRTEDYTSDALAAAARASASFPAAFAPSALTGEGARLGGFVGVKRWVIDGGLLENAPIQPALELIPTRRSDRLATRFVCYVNAAPKQLAQVDDDPKQPHLRAILGHVVNLPRDARFIDQLRAIEGAAQRSSAVRELASGLLQLDSPSLKATANALLPAYQMQRTLQSLQEAFLSSSDAATDVVARVDAVVERLDARPDTSLPWIPRDLRVPTQAGEWRWGLRGAQRILLLQRDITRAAIETAETQEEADALLTRVRPIEKALVSLEGARDRFAADTTIRDLLLALAEAAESTFDEHLADLEARMVSYRSEIHSALQRGTESLYHALGSATLCPGVPSAATLFGEPEGPAFAPAHQQSFLERALCIEVVRRSFASDRDMEPAEQLHMVQLTPLAPVRIFTDTPLRKTGPASGTKKLTGLNWANFSAFYRSSWRANDFMWGRLDAASRIVDLLVDARRAALVSGRTGATPTWTTLARLLVPDGVDEESVEKRRLVEEALRDAARAPLPARVPKGVAQAASGLGEGQPPREQLREHLGRALEADLKAANGGFFAQVVCARAAQYEILQQELGPLAAATAADGKLGCFTRPITLDETQRPLASARHLLGGDRTLPQILGSRDRDESTSTLAVRTLSHTVLVLLASLKTLGVPLAGMFAPIRAPFLSLAGMTAEKWWNRVASLLAFVAGSSYLTARAVTAEGSPEARLSELWAPSSLAAGVAALAVVGLVALPLWRAVRARQTGRKIRQGTWGIALFSASGLAALLTAFFDVGTANALASTGGFALPTTLAWIVVAAPLGAAVVVQRVPIPDLGKRGLGRVVARSGMTALTLALVAAAVLWYSVPELWAVLGQGGWRAPAAVASFASLPLAFLYGLHGFLRAFYDLRVRRSRGGFGAA
jgi:patatin-related protein